MTNTRMAIAGWQGSRKEDPTTYLTPLQYGQLLAEAAPKLAALATARGTSAPASSIQPAGRESGQANEPGDEMRDCAECPALVLVPAGGFMMGSPANEAGRSDDEGPQHSVTIAAPFWVGKYEVTFAEWDACAAAGGCQRKPDDAGWGRQDRPVINVSWHDANEYVGWLGRRTHKAYRLLSEAEWEYVARAGTTTAYWWGNEIGHGRANCHDCGSEWDCIRAAPVGSFRANGFGLYDTAGNVWEWVEDCWHGSYHGAPSDGSPWTSGNCSRRVLRGGSWYFLSEGLRSADRDWNITDNRLNYLGFRVARTLR